MSEAEVRIIALLEQVVSLLSEKSADDEAPARLYPGRKKGERRAA